jgi:hypothetical protein
VRRIRNGVRPVANSWCAPALSPGVGRRRRRCLENRPHDGDSAEAVGEGDGVSGPRLAVSGAGRQDHGGASRARSPRPPAPQPRAHAGTTGWIPWGWLSINSIARESHLGQAASVRGPSNQVLSEVLRAGRESTAGLSPLSTPDSILICYRNKRLSGNIGKHISHVPSCRVLPRKPNKQPWHKTCWTMPLSRQMHYIPSQEEERCRR